MSDTDSSEFRYPWRKGWAFVRVFAWTSDNVGRATLVIYKPDLSTLARHHFKDGDARLRFHTPDVESVIEAFFDDPEGYLYPTDEATSVTH